MNNGVLVERHVQGDDHRLAVFGGAFAWCVRRSPPRLIGADRPLIDRVTTWVQATGRRVGTTDAAVTALAGHPRCKDADQLPERVMALLLDAGCEALVISASPDDVERHGFPLDRCAVALIAEGAVVGKPLRKLIDDCADCTVEGVTEGNFDQRAAPTLTAALGEPRALR